MNHTDTQESHQGCEGRPAPLEGDAKQSVLSSIDDPPYQSVVKNSQEATPFFVVGLGAAVGGLEALGHFFAHIPIESGMAFVVIQHLLPDYKDMVFDILSKQTAIPVMEVTHGMKIKPNTIYLAPDKKSMTLLQGRLHLVEKEYHHGVSLPIDTFLHSLAQERKEYAIAIILSGTGSDGTQGIHSIKEEGGMVLAQQLETTAFDEMPRHAIATGLVDVISPPEEMATALLRIVCHFPQIVQKDHTPSENPLIFNPFGAVLALLKEETQIDFRQYKSSMVLRRIERRMGILQLQHMEDYLEYLKASDKERKRLHKDLLVGVTKFFRDIEAFQTLGQIALASIFSTKSENEAIRVWVPGCATGEEAYSLAILLMEYQTQLGSSFECQIFATDIDADAIRYAAEGSYLESSVAEISPERLQKFFIKKEDSRYQVSQKLRKMVVFAQHDLIQSPPFGKIDLVSCRNLFIYLQPSTQEHITHLFHFALKPNGFLFLGSGEIAPVSHKLFQCIDKKHSIYRYESNGCLTPSAHASYPIACGHNHRLKLRGTNPHNYSRPPLQPLDELLQEWLLAEYLPPCVIINHHLDVLYVSEKARPYLHLPTGRLSHHLERMLDDNVMAIVRTAIHHVIKHNQSMRYKVSITTIHNERETVDLKVNRLATPQSDQGEFLSIIFQPYQATGNQEEDLVYASTQKFSEQKWQHFNQIEQEFLQTRESLQVTIRELEVSNEALQMTNQELLASNEELRSANEELQAVNEELQAINEEMLTLNREHQHKIQTLVELSDTINNLLRSTDIGTIFLDKSLRIRRYTPAITQEIHLIETDIGRPFEDIHHRLAIPDLNAKMQEVLQQQHTYTDEVQGGMDRWYILKILPYITAEEQVQGVVLTLTDITDRRRMEENVKRSEAQLRNYFDQTLMGMLSCTPDGKLLQVNDKLCLMLGYPRKELLGLNWSQLSHPEDSATEQRHFRRMLEGELKSYVIDHRYLNKLDRPIPVNLAVSCIRNEKNQVEYVVGLVQDLSERRKADESERARRVAEAANRAKSEFLSNVSHEIRTPMSAILGFADLLYDQIDQPAQRGYLDMIRKSGKELITLINDILDLSRVEAGRLEIIPQPTNITNLLNELRQVFELDIRRKGLNFTVHITKDLAVEILIDSIRLRQILFNLIGNAVKFTEQGEVQVFIQTEGEAITDLSQTTDLVIKVSDTGQGIPENVQNLIFEPFRQQPMRRKRQEGLGLGLAVCKRLIEVMNGTIRVESQVGKGSTFEVILRGIPIYRTLSKQWQKPLESTTKSKLPPATVLVVDDVESNRVLLRALLGRMGLHVFEAADGEEALVVAAQSLPDVVLMDIRMPKMDGYETVKRFKANPVLCNIPVIALTATIIHSATEKLTDYGFVDYLYKPITAEQLLTILDRILRESKNTI